MRISVKIEEILPVIISYIKDKYGIKDDVELIYSSKTTFLSFDSKEYNENMKKENVDSKKEIGSDMKIKRYYEYR